MKDYEACKTENFVTDTTWYFNLKQFWLIVILLTKNFYSSFEKQRHNQAMHSEPHHKLNSCMVSLQCALSCALPIFVAY